MLPDSCGGNRETLAFHPQISTLLLTLSDPLTCLLSHFTSFLRGITAVSHTQDDLPAC